MIRILIEDALQNPKTPIAWLVFRHMPIEDDIRALTYDVSPTVNEEEEIRTEAEEEEVKQEEEETKGDEDEMDEEGDEIE